ncbi:TetR/AcrR family transcriptional regulator, partial [Mycolicibacterium sp. CBMA 361]|uniref:TetR/AcrR family transcriptional regulator n=1 Tax=Mycolicibacterium sp. CBMA 361 TaxID=2606610 RepID=UPI0031BB22D3
MSTAAQTRAPRGRRATRPSGDEREAAILATATTLLQQRSFSEISVDDLAKGAGISRPTFYFYFPSKEAVLLSLLDPLIKRADTGFDGALEDMPADPKEAIRHGIEIFFSSFGSHPATARAGVEAVRTVPEFREVWAGLMLLAAHISRHGTMTEWMDASILDETDPSKRDAELDLYNPDNPN